MGKGILPGLQQLNNVQDDDPRLNKVELRSQITEPRPPTRLLEQAGSPDQLLPDSLTKDYLQGEPVCLCKTVLIFIVQHVLLALAS